MNEQLHHALSVARTPYGCDKDTIRRAVLTVCDSVESLERNWEIASSACNKEAGKVARLTKERSDLVLEVEILVRQRNELVAALELIAGLRFLATADRMQKVAREALASTKENN